MKYYRYPFIKNRTRQMVHERIKEYNRFEKRNYYIGKLLSFLVALSFFVFVSIIAYFAMNVQEYIHVSILATVVGVLLWIIMLPLPIFLVITIFRPIFHRFPHHSLPKVTYEIINKATKPMRKYYKISGEYIVTKCYYSTDNNMTNKDIILFICQNKIRIVNDFTRSIKDFGCYEFLLDEIKVYNKAVNTLVMTIIESKSITIHLGKRARTYIYRNFSVKK